MMWMLNSYSSGEGLDWVTNAGEHFENEYDAKTTRLVDYKNGGYRKLIVMIG